MDQEILEALYRRHYSAAILYCMSLCGDEHLAQDLVSDAFIKAYLSLPDEIPSFQYWLLRVCKNIWIDHLRKQKFRAEAESRTGLQTRLHRKRHTYRARSAEPFGTPFVLWNLWTGSW